MEAGFLRSVSKSIFHLHILCPFCAQMIRMLGKLDVHFQFPFLSVEIMSPGRSCVCAAVATWKKGRVDTVKMRLFLPSTIVSLGSVVHVGSQSNSQVLRFSQRCSCLWTFASKTFYGGKRTFWDLLVCHLADIIFYICKKCTSFLGHLLEIV